MSTALLDVYTIYTVLLADTQKLRSGVRSDVRAWHNLP